MERVRTKIDLGGEWNYLVKGCALGLRKVPASYPVEGEYTLAREIPHLEFNSTRGYWLCFDAITNQACVYLDDQRLGEMVPWVPYQYDITQMLSNPGPHRVSVDIKDLNTPAGYSTGWESKGGIIREVYIEIKPAVFLQDWQVLTHFERKYQVAVCVIRVQVRNMKEEDIQCQLTGSLTSSGPVEANSFITTAHEPTVAIVPAFQSATLETVVEVDAPALWSPEHPNLYQLRLEVAGPQGFLDSIEKEIGLREFIVRGNQFLLNGTPIFLKGVCRHDQWPGQGYTLTTDQMETDMRMIKEMGANYVRLAHYPHHEHIIELADRIGLLVSEEPGPWNEPSGDQVVWDTFLEILKRTILRDRNHPSVFAWLLGNECQDVPYYTARGTKMVRDLDPTRLVTFSDNDKKKETADGYQWDYYDQHFYPFYPREMFTLLTPFTGKPFVLGEWGGGYIMKDNIGMWRMFTDIFSQLSHSPEEFSYNLCGIAYCWWNSFRQYGTGYPEAPDGVHIGLVTEQREKRLGYYLLTELFRSIDTYQPGHADPVPHVVEDVPILALNPTDATFELIDLRPVARGLDQERIWESFEKKGQRTQFEGWPDVTELAKFNQESRKVRVGWQSHGLVIGSIPFDSITNHPRPDGKPFFPILLSDECSQINIPIGRQVRCLHFLGQVAIDGWPTFGDYGDLIAEYIFEYEDGTSEVFPIRNGMEIGRYRAQHRASRLNIVTTHARPALEWKYDQDFDQNVVRYIGFNPSENKRILRLRLNLLDDRYKPFLFAITAEL